MTMPDYDDPTCPSCGVPLSEHDGLIPTCERLREAREDNERLTNYRCDWRKLLDEQLALRLEQAKEIERLSSLLHDMRVEAAEGKLEIERLRSLLDRVPHSEHWKTRGCYSSCLRCEIDRVLKGATP